MFEKILLFWEYTSQSTFDGSFLHRYEVENSCLCEQRAAFFERNAKAIDCLASKNDCLDRSFFA